MLKPITAAFCVVLLMCSATQSYAMRVVSVGGGITEIVYALGAEDTLVGVDTTSVYPEVATKLPQVGYMRALSIEGVASLKPDVIVLTEDAGPPQSIKAFRDLGLRVVTLNNEASINGLNERIDTLAQLFNKQRKGNELKTRLVQEYNQLEKQLANQTEKKKALFILSHGGHALSIAGNGTTADSLLTLAGVENVARNFHGYRILGQEGVFKLDPAVIITTQQGVDAWGGANKILEQDGVKFTQAAKDDKLLAMDAMYLLSFGPRVISAAKELNEIIYQ